MKLTHLASALAALAFAAGAALADVPGRTPPTGFVPNPGTQTQELSNITPHGGVYNVFDSPFFCASCHGGTIDASVSHYGNWSGSNMANSGRDPFFRANNLVVNSDAYYITEALLGPGQGVNGVGNICWRCHSPNGWYSSRLDETLGGRIDATTVQQSMVASTDMQGISCEFCHRTIGNVTQQRAGLDPADPAWKLLAGATDWPHAGNAYPEGPVAGLPYGDTTFQFTDSRIYQADLAGNTLIFWNDVPSFKAGFITDPAAPLGTYTGQTYGIYPNNYDGPRRATPTGMPKYNSLDQEIVYLPDGRAKTQFEVGISGPPVLDPVTGLPVLDPVSGLEIVDHLEQSLSPRHGTHVGAGAEANGHSADTGNVPYRYVVTAEMCGSCHDLTVPTLNSGMPEQRTYTEWFYSDYGTGRPGNIICQDCHMGETAHEYKDGFTDALTGEGTYKADPAKAGFFPYAKERPLSAVHRFSPANRDLAPILKYLNPDVDMEATGRQTGRDTRTEIGVVSGRDRAWDRHEQYGNQKIRDAATIQITQQPTLVVGQTDIYEVKVLVTNLTGHALPSGYPDGRRAFITLNVRDASNSLVYQSGSYDEATAHLTNGMGAATLTRAHTPLIDATVQNRVMLYEKRTGAPNGDGTFTMGESLLNPVIVFDNRLRPTGWEAPALAAGVRLVDYSGSDTALTPFDVNPDPLQPPGSQGGRYEVGQSTDTVTYRFQSPTVPTQAEARFYYQSHTRDFVEYLKDRNNEETAKDLAGDPLHPARPNTLGGPRPEGTPSILEPNYPNTPNYLGARINLAGQTDLAGQPLQDNWGSLAYAAWNATGRGAPALIDADSTAYAAAPAAPVVTATAVDQYSINLSWPAVPAAEGYRIQARFGTAAVDGPGGIAPSRGPVAVVIGATSFVHDGLKPGKTYGYEVAAFNGKGETLSALVEATTPGTVPATPSQLELVGVSEASVALRWRDTSTDEVSWIVERQELPDPSTGVISGYAVVGTPASVTTPATGGWVTFTDATAKAGRVYSYRVAAVNASGQSLYASPGPREARTNPYAPNGLTRTLATRFSVTLRWNDNSAAESGFVVERSTDNVTFTTIATKSPNARLHVATGLTPGTTYYFRVRALNGAVRSAPSPVLIAATLP
ncbi:MAG: fibronectin type III domain-containing protein [Anaeromyxobacter sp.]|nr:fibronectin type III domain-containing protein [Anaeromyxobacter sp.]MBL0278074.1 fibronectin type III domain-containing protein [Anaeromyxobacter sp.]